MNRELLLLGLLRKQKMHGYRLMDFIDENLSTCTDLKKSTAYYLLEKMALSGWVRYEEDQSSNRPPRKIYMITSAGEEVFQKLLREKLRQYQPVYFPGDSALIFLDELPAKERTAYLEERLDRLREVRRQLSAIPVHTGLIQLTIEHQIHHLDSEENWLGSIIKLLKEQTDTDTFSKELRNANR